ncbi:ATP-binding cassette domain-containing protein [Alteromonas sp. KUL49]|uniref:ATP-binding cassette domain-containing protein n=1 Tax=Alteromonas sp. KUL49 TaxID=2480798 RepID=UPI00102EE948|nr:ATP-binding cassette domain-containing protein [Alteromonas sp. KUL49]TAP37349.1 ATP-binding cassette domain-containing protein [Alteromonas sp. KUL49]GEA12979.1 molybdenum import ATP-binding protein ModC [Alteromonas sp. KUL49]
MEFSVSLNQRVSLSASFSPAAKMLGVSGVSGAGKSSLLSALAGAEPSAKVNVDWGIDAARVGVVFQQPMLFPNLSVQDNLLLSKRYAKQGSIEFQKVVEGCEISELLQRPVTTLSGGEGQRVAIARALLNGPDILLLDEALSAIDITRRHRIYRFLSANAETGYFRCVYVSHDWQDLALFSDALLIIDKGRKQHSGMTQDVLNAVSVDELGSNPFALLEGEVTQTAEQSAHALQIVSIDNTPLFVNQCSVVDSRAKFVLYASDVSISIPAKDNSLESEQSSILNALCCEIKMINDSEAKTSGKVLLTLQAGNQCFYSRISVLSLSRLGLEKGQQVVARFKAL